MKERTWNPPLTQESSHEERIKFLRNAISTRKYISTLLGSEMLAECRKSCRDDWYDAAQYAIGASRATAAKTHLPFPDKSPLDR